MDRQLVFARLARVALVGVCLLSTIPATALASVTPLVRPAVSVAALGGQDLSLSRLGGGGRRVPLALLQSLLSTPHGRALLRGGLDATTVGSLERHYATGRSREYYASSPLIQPVRSEQDLLPHVATHATHTARARDMSTEQGGRQDNRATPRVLPAPPPPNLYVDNVSANASDANPCASPALPCRTIHGALAKAAPRNVISLAGDFYNETVTIMQDLTLSGTANTETTIDGGSFQSSVITVAAGAHATIFGLTVENGSPAPGGGYASDGGGIKNSGALTVTASQVVGNMATQGGGIYNSGTLLLRDSTVADNRTGTANGGAGIHNTGVLTIVNSTISANTGAANGGFVTGGGGLVNDATATLYSSTVVSNTAGSGDGGVRNNSAIPVTLTDTIVAGNTKSGLPADCSGDGLIASGGYNLVGDGTCVLTDGVNGDRVGSSAQPLDARLGPLSLNSGASRTQRPLPGSPAVDHGAPAGCGDNTGAILTNDQRDMRRPYPTGGRCDVGAVEAQYPLVTGLNPGHGPPGGGTSVIISGTGFTFPGGDVGSVTSIAFGSALVCGACFTVSPSGTLITVTAPLGAGTGPVDVVVTTSEGSSPITAADQFYYGAPPTSTPIPPTATTTSAQPTASNTPSALPPTVTSTPAAPTTTSAATAPVPTSTRTNTPTSTSTSTPTSTPTSTSTSTSTSIPISTNTPRATSTVPAGDCFHVTIAGWTFLATACPSNHQVGNVQVIPPSGLTVEAAISPLPSLTLDDNNRPALPIALPDLTIGLGGYTVSAQSASLSAAGLTIGTIGLTLPAAFGGAGVTATNVLIGSDGTLNGTVALAPGDIAATYAGFSVELKGLTLSHVAGGATTLRVDTLTFTIPSDILPAGAPNTLTVNNIHISSDGTFGADPLNLPPFNVTLAGFTITVNGVTLGAQGFSVGDAEVSLPANLLPQGSGAVTVMGSLTITRQAGRRTTLSGSLSAGPLALNLAGFAVSVDNITLDNADGLRVANARIALTSASGLFPNGAPTLTGDLRISPSFQVLGSLGTGAIAIAAAGFSVATDGITLDNTDGLRISNARLALTGAGGLFPNGAPTLTGNLAISPSFKLTGSLSTGAVSLSMAGFTVSADGVTLDTTTGLQVSNARLSLAGSALFANAAPTLTGNLVISPSFKISGSLSTGPVGLALAGFTVSVSNIVLDNSGLTVSGPQLALPSSLFSGPGSGAGSGPVVAFDGSLRITPQLTVSATLGAAPQGLSVTFGGTILSVTAITFDTVAGLTVKTAYTLPSALGGGALLGTLTVSPAFQVGGSLELDAPQFSFQGFNARADRISLDATGALAVQNMRVDVPLDTLNLGTPTLSGNLTAHVGAHGLAVSGFLSATSLPHFTYGGFDASVASIELDVAGAAGAPISATVTAHNLRVGVTLPGGASHTFGGDVAISVGQAPRLVIDNSLLAYGGFDISVRQFVLSPGGVSVDGASLDVPLGPGHGTLTLVGALSIKRANGKTEVTGFIELPNARLSVDGIVVSVQRLRLDNTGLSVGAASIDLDGNPDLADGLAALHIPLHSIGITGLRISTHFDVSGGVVNINGSDTLAVSFDGASLSLGNISFGNAGLIIGTLNVTLPDVLGGQTLTLRQLIIGRNGVVIDQPLSFSLADFSVSATALSIEKGGFKMSGVSFTLPVIQGPISVGDMGYDGHKLTIADLPLPADFTIPSLTTGAPISAVNKKADCDNSGGTYLPLPPINAGGFSVNGAACLTFGRDTAGHSTYLVVGQGSVSLADIGSLSCSFELGSPSGDFPYVFHHAMINVEFAAGLPIDETGLEINGILGGIGITQGADHNPIYSLEVGADFQSDDGGYLINGNLRLNFATDGNFGIGGNAQLLRLLNVGGGFCVRIVNVFDFVCQGSLPDPTFAKQASHGTGLYAEVNGSLSATLHETAYLAFDVRGHIWVDGDGPELAASASIAAHLPSDFVSPGLPPCGADASASAQLGKFYDGSGNKTFGVKADFDVHVCPVDITWGICSISCSHTHTDLHLSAGIFIDDHGNAHFDDSGYTLIEGQNHDGYLLARLGDGGAVLSRVGPLVLPPALDDRLQRPSPRSTGARVPSAGIRAHGQGLARAVSFAAPLFAA